MLVYSLVLTSQLSTASSLFPCILHHLTALTRACTL